MENNIDMLVATLALTPHPEGGYFRRTYESAEFIDTENGVRKTMTSIYYLLTRGDKSRWHRLKSNERWFFHKGGVLNIHLLLDGDIVTKKLGCDFTDSQPIVDVAPNTWFCAEISDNSEYSLVSCVVSPGFDFKDFELADASLLDTYAHHSDFIRKFLA